MKKEITLPKLSESDEKGMISEIYVSEGDTVDAEQSILAVESDKATVDVPVEEGGKVLEIKVKEGEEIGTGDLLLILETDTQTETGSEKETETETKTKTKTKTETGNETGKEREKSEKEDGTESETETETKTKTKSETGKESEKSEKEKETGKEKDKKSEEEKSVKAEKESETEKEKEMEKEKENKNQDSDRKEQSGSGEGIHASPMVKELARELGIDLAQLQSVKSDKNSRISREDIYAYVREHMKHGNTPDRESSNQEGLPDFSQWGETETHSLSGIRRATARVTTQSWTTIPHVTNHEEADVTRINDYLSSKKEDEKITITAVLLKILAKGMKKFPKFNTSLDATKNELIYKQYVNIGVAVDTEDGLLMPVVKDADKLSLTELSEELGNLAGKARDRKLKKEEMEGGNIVLSNLGGIGGTSFTPIIFPPHVAILGVSRTQVRAVMQDGGFKPAQMLPLSLSYDHRVIDGAEAARFLSWMKQGIENPIELLMD